MTLRNHEIIGLIFCATGIADLYILPKILSKNTGASMKNRARIIKFVKFGSYLFILLGVLILLGLISIPD